MSVNTDMERGRIWLTEVHDNLVLITVLAWNWDQQPKRLSLNLKTETELSVSLKNETRPYQSLSYQVETHKYQ